MNTLSVRVWRTAADGSGGRFVAYEVPRLPAQTVLDVVTYIQRRIDSTLAYRFACRVGMCGSCAMTVNGRARWTCRTHVEAAVGGGGLEIAPLAHLPVIRDLVTDMREFFDKWARARGQFVPTATRRDDFAAVAPASRERRDLQPAAANRGRDVRATGPARAAVDRHRARAAHPDPAGEPVGVCRIDAPLDVGDDVEDGLRREPRHVVRNEAAA